MDKATIQAMLSKVFSNLRAADVLKSRKQLAERGYEVERMLGCGSFGAVLLAKNIQSQKKVAIKLIFIEKDNQLHSFYQEFAILKKLVSPHTVNLLDMVIDLENNYFFLFMNFEENGNIEDYIANNPNMNDSQIITMFIQILQGLIYLKENKIIHGDLKPQNILLSSSNSPKLADFGISTQLRGSRVQQTKKGDSLFYEAPEQHIEQKYQIESDWFAAGLILLRLCGNIEGPYMLQILQGSFPNMTELRHQNIVKVAFQMLATSPKDRASPEKVIAELQKILQSLPLLPPPPKPEIRTIQNDDGYYLGETKNNESNGQGKFFWNDGRRYEGECKDGNPHGQGKLFWNNGDRYEGECKDGNPHGQGEFFWNFGGRYEGEYKDGKQHGQGKLFQNDGGRYEGECKDGKYHGQGEFFWNDGDRYKGEWKDGKLHGQGEFFWNFGGRYEGEYKDGKQHGQGKLFQNDGGRYEGEWKDDKRHGQGKFFFNSGSRYEGEWKDDKRHGQGKLFWNNGDQYEGEWKDGKQHGQGKLFQNDGDSFEGEWKDGKQHGQGKLFWNDGRRYEGECKDGKLDGQGEFFLNDGSRYEGEWQEGWINGKGKKFDSKGKLIEEGLFSNGVLYKKF